MYLDLGTLSCGASPVNINELVPAGEKKIIDIKYCVLLRKHTGMMVLSEWQCVPRLPILSAPVPSSSYPCMILPPLENEVTPRSLTLTNT